ncbi:MAG: formate dehydrogenase [Rhodospirillales bacterium]|nr:formate dehydrogenase [Rhodospirillales bacterium]MBT4007201.1 formate dehydrogenase [Rhodospirillales bacterium]MBT5113534.1 formate dehydrogenase [Rhodospirillales bacterium]MBT5673832.1 formate dehydrogenase [Rhodospirillales bacterium]MBT6186490.1 formate dehydrogenase [Rhodospirillales bacterium]
MNNKTVTVYVPVDAAAQSVGSESVVAEILAEAKTRDIDIQIVRNGSRGMLWLEPLLEVVTDQGRVAYGPVAASDVAGLFDAGFLQGGSHALGHGITEEIDYLKRQTRLTFARVGVIDPLSLDDFKSHGGFEGLTKALELGPEKIVDAVISSGLRGRGGAGFPTGIKWKTVMGAPGPKKYICCNADEGDSGTFADRMLMEGDPFTLIEGMIIAAIAVDADQGFIYLRSEYPHAIKTMKRAIEIATHSGYLGDNIAGSDKRFTVEVRVGGGAYICGEETSMLESLEGKRGMVRAKPPIPALEGLFGKPTVVNNVLSFASVPVILVKGADYYAGLGVGRSLGTQPFQLGGNIKYGGLIEIPFGSDLGELINGFGGGTRTGKPVRAVQVGGPLGAYLPTSQFGVALDYEAFAAAGAMLGHGGLSVFDDDVDMARQARFAMEFCAIESCGKCTPCRIGSTRGVEVIDKIIGNQDHDKNMQLLDDLCETMRDGSLCALGGLTPMPVKSALTHFPEDFSGE